MLVDDTAFVKRKKGRPQFQVFVPSLLPKPEPWHPGLMRSSNTARLPGDGSALDRALHKGVPGTARDGIKKKSGTHHSACREEEDLEGEVPESVRQIVLSLRGIGSTAGEIPSLSLTETDGSPAATDRLRRTASGVSSSSVTTKGGSTMVSTAPLLPPIAAQRGAQQRSTNGAQQASNPKDEWFHHEYLDYQRCEFYNLEFGIPEWDEEHRKRSPTTSCTPPRLRNNGCPSPTQPQPPFATPVSSHQRVGKR